MKSYLVSLFATMGNPTAEGFAELLLESQNRDIDLLPVPVQALMRALVVEHSESYRNSSSVREGMRQAASSYPDATRVAGMYAWNQLGRKVIKGQRGIRILAPLIGIRKKKDITRQKQPALVGFRSAYVFEVNQTEGAPPPDLSVRVKGEVGEYRKHLIDF